MRILCLLGLAFMSVASAAPPPVVDFVEKPMVDSVQISPSGAYISMVIPRDDHSDLLVLDRATRKQTALLSLRRDEYVGNYWWVEDERLVVAFAQRLGDLDAPTFTGELYGINADGKKGKYLFGYRGKESTGTLIKAGQKQFASATMLEERADEDHRVLIGIRAWSRNGEPAWLKFARIDVYSAALTSMGTAPVRYDDVRLTDHDGHLRLLGGSLSDRYHKLYFRTTPEADWVLVNDQASSDRILYPLAYARDGEHVYAMLEDGKGPAALVRWNPTTGAEDQLLRDDYASIGNVVLTADRKDAYAVHLLGGRGGYAFIDSAAVEAQLTRAVMQAYPGESVIASSFSRDGRYAIIEVTSDLTAPQFLLLDRDQQKLTTVVAARPKLKADQMALMEPIAYKAADGLPIHGYLTKPNGADKNLPLVVYVHGGPYGEFDHWGFDNITQLLASRGYAVLQINYRGSGGYGKAFQDSGIREWGGKMQDDLADGVNWAVEQGVADPQRVCIVGASYGGYAALMGVVKTPDLYRCAVGYAGVYDLALMRKRGETTDSAWGRDYLGDIFADDEEWLRQRSPAKRAAEIKAAVLLIHGGQDERVPPGHAYAMRDALQVAGKPFEWYFERAEAHGFYQTEHNVTAFEKVLAFLDRNIGSGKP